MNTKLVLQPNNVKEVQITLSEDILKPEFNKAIEHFKPSINVEGFRKGQAPNSIVKTKIDPAKLNNRVLEQLSNMLVTKSIEEHKLKPISSPKLDVKTISETGFSGSLFFVERPTIKLADYKKLVKEAYKIVDSEQLKVNSGEEDKKKTEKGEKKAEKKTKEQIEHEEHEKIHKFEHDLVEKIYDLLIDKSQIDLADQLIEDETNRLITSFLNYLTRLGIKFEDYVKQTGADIKKIQEDYKVQATKNLKVEFILSEIVKKEEIKVEQKEIDEAINATPDANYRKELQKEANKYYIESQLLKQKALRKLLELSGFNHFH